MAMDNSEYRKREGFGDPKLKKDYGFENGKDFQELCGRKPPQPEPERKSRPMAQNDGPRQGKVSLMDLIARASVLQGRIDAISRFVPESETEVDALKSLLYEQGAELIKLTEAIEAISTGILVDVKGAGIEWRQEWVDAQRAMRRAAKPDPKKPGKGGPDDRRNRRDDR